MKVAVLVSCLTAQFLTVISARPLITSSTQQDFAGPRVRHASMHACHIATPDRKMWSTGSRAFEGC